MAVASLVLGIIAVVVAVIPLLWGFWWIGLVCGLVAIVLAVLAKKSGNGGGLATAGLVLGIVGAVLCLAFYIACVALTSSVSNTLEQELMRQLNQ